ncbi:hypothetical protein GTPT_2740 [Tatumella ptyseos ATCC 33301]|uniref:Uncharacterized protein n=1 Tax=Tatumella ptyseos ATCC 33301 TaxID=1005995 RepID=A0A085JC12_9GAMM|nr:hypothetical protein GTPT_2740 [Tatumella ptyseos ATCC 33301]
MKLIFFMILISFKKIICFNRTRDEQNLGEAGENTSGVTEAGL